MLHWHTWHSMYTLVCARPQRVLRASSQSPTSPTESPLIDHTPPHLCHEPAFQAALRL